jgi:deoxyribodipyrimidine photolyase-related protein
MALTLILGNQLHRDWLEPSPLQLPPASPVLMVEDLGIASSYRYHKQRLLHTFVAMRAFADRLRQHGHRVSYGLLSESAQRPFWQRLAEELALAHQVSPWLRISEVADPPFQQQLERFCQERGVRLEILPSPAFLESAADSRAWFNGRRRPWMKTFYERQRRRLGLLLEADGSPSGGRWSFDADNRRRLPKGYRPPPLPPVASSGHEATVRALIECHFAANPGQLGPLTIPWDQAGADAWLASFLRERLDGFGPYEDALSSQYETLHHSLLSPLLNIGLLNPGPVVAALLGEVEARSLPGADPAGPVPIASLEGFLRQLIGWREFVRGIHLVHGEAQASSNFWGHHRRLAPCWKEASTGLPPLDRAIERLNRTGYNHHIERLMVISCLMLLCEIEPGEVHRWFMEMYLDSYDWVMGPNVYGMGLMSDGGIFATKPYICGSNYMLKLGDYPKGPWCAIWDGLYWRFIDRHRPFFAANPRLAMAVRTLDRMEPARYQDLLQQAEAFLARVTEVGDGRGC